MAKISRKQEVIDYVYQALEDGSLQPGQKITERSLSMRLKISRTPVREALSELESRAILKKVPNSGYSIVNFSEREARELFEIMGPLDGRAALLALPNIGKSEIAQMSFLIDSMDIAIECGLTDRYYSLQKEFHEFYIDRCGNERLIDMLDSIMQFFNKKSYERLDVSAIDNLRKANEEHRRILELFKEGKAKELQSYIRDVHWSLAYIHFTTWKVPE